MTHPSQILQSQNFLFQFKRYVDLEHHAYRPAVFFFKIVENHKSAITVLRENYPMDIKPEEVICLICDEAYRSKTIFPASLIHLESIKTLRFNEIYGLDKTFQNASEVFDLFESLSDEDFACRYSLFIPFKTIEYDEHDVFNAMGLMFGLDMDVKQASDVITPSGQYSLYRIYEDGEESFPSDQIEGADSDRYVMDIIFEYQKHLIKSEQLK